LKARRVRTSFFEKKEAKKLLLNEAVGGETAAVSGAKVFWLLFFKKVTASSFEGTY
jgi:hypothetical protein